MSRTVKMLETSNIEPSTESVELHEVFETADEKFRREWNKAGADWAFWLLKFLQGFRRNEISLSEIVRTQTYAHSTPREKDALKFIAEQSEQHTPLSDEDRRMLIERDDFLVRHVARETLGHADWVAEIQGIPAAVARAQAVD